MKSKQYLCWDLVVKVMGLMLIEHLLNYLDMWSYNNMYSIPSNMAWVWPLIAIMPGARLNQVGKCMLAIMAGPS